MNAPAQRVQRFSWITLIATTALASVGLMDLIFPPGRHPISDALGTSIPWLATIIVISSLIAKRRCPTVSIRQGWIGAGVALVASLLHTILPFPYLALPAIALSLSVAQDATSGHGRALRVISLALTMNAVLRLSDAVFLWTGPMSAWLQDRLAETPGEIRGLAEFRFFGAAFALLTICIFASVQRGYRLVIAGLGLTAVLIASRPLFDSGRGVPLAATALGVVGLTAALTRAKEEARTGRRAALVTVGAGLVGVILTFHLAAPPTNLSESSVLVIEGAYESELPKDDGKRSKQASLATFFQFLRTSVKEVVTTTRVTDEDLKGRNLVFICNLARELGADEVTRLHDYVAAGGSLLVLGDHTDIFGVMKFTNPLIERFGVALRFDSAMPYGTGWDGSFDLRWHPATVAAGSGDLVRISVGATLETKSPARAMIVARRGFADFGDRKAPEKAFLGNWAYDKGSERFGDLVLGADSIFGKGRVAVFGDTSFLQETSFSASWPFVSSLLGWLLSPSDSSPSPWRSAAGLSLLALALLAACAVLRTRDGALVACALVAGSAITIKCSRDSWEAPVLPRSVAWIDFKSGSNMSSKGKDANSMDGLVSSLAMSGRTPLLLTDRDAPRQGPLDLQVLPSASGPKSQRELRKLDDFVSRGGTVLALVGPSDGEAFEAVFLEHGLRFTGEPLGTCPGALFQNELPVATFRQGFGLAVEKPSAESLVSCFGKSVVTEVKRGDGRWIWVTDPEFLTDQNLLIRDDLKPSNVTFLKSVLARSE